MSPVIELLSNIMWAAGLALGLISGKNLLNYVYGPAAAAMHESDVEFAKDAFLGVLLSASIIAWAAFMPLPA